MTLSSYLPGCCRLILGTGLLSLSLQNYFEQWEGCWIFFHHRGILLYSVCFSLIAIFQSILLPSPLFSIHLNLSVCLLSPSLFLFLPSSSIFIFPLHCFHPSIPQAPCLTFKYRQRKEVFTLNCGHLPWTWIECQSCVIFSVLNSYRGLRWSLWISFTLRWVSQDLLLPPMFHKNQKD